MIRRWHPGLVLLAATLIAVGLAFLGAIGFSRYYWGYFFSPPGFDERVREATTVQTFTFFLKDNSQKDAFYQLQELMDEDIRAAASQPANELAPDPVSYGRVAAHLIKAGVIKRSPATLPAADAAIVFQLMRDTGKLEVEGLSGVMLEFSDARGEKMLFVAANGEPGIGGAVSNDHYPYYEFLFSRPSVGGPPRLLSFKHCYFDIAGIEGLQWPRVFMFLAMALFTLIVTPVAAYLVVRAWRDRRAGLARGFPIDVISGS